MSRYDHKIETSLEGISPSLLGNNHQKKNYNSKREDNKGEDQPEDERNVIL